MDLHHLKRSVPASVTGLLLCALAMGHGPASTADGAEPDAIPMRLWTAVDTPLNRAYFHQFEKFLKEESTHTITTELISREKTSSVAEALNGLVNAEADLYLMPWAALSSFNNAKATWEPVNPVGNSNVPQVTVSAAPHGDLTFYVISQYLSGLTTYVMKAPVHSIADLKGKKIRLVGASPIYYRLLRKFGAIPIPSQFGDERPPGTTSVIDGAHVPMVWPLAKDWYKSTPNLVISPNAYTATLAMLSDAWFSNRPANMKNALVKALVKAGAKMTDWAKSATLRSNSSLTKEWLKKGGSVQFIPLLSDNNKIAWMKGYSETIDEMSAAVEGSSMKLKY